MVNPAKGLRLRGSARTSVGQVRTHNEDNIHLWKKGSYVLAIVADGMGGAAAGEEASRITVETVIHELGLDDETHLSPTDIREDLLRKSIEAANLNILEQAAAKPVNKGMGTTVTIAFFHGRDVIVAHVGDSRAYRISANGYGEQITSDHSFVQALVDAGHITNEEAENHPMGNILYRALGQTEDIDVDIFHRRLNPGDKIVLCSDGLTRHVRTAEIFTAVNDSDDPGAISQLLIDLANLRGGEDNISVIVIGIERASETSNIPKPNPNDDIHNLILGEDTEDLSDTLDIDLPLSEDNEGIDIVSPDQ